MPRPGTPAHQQLPPGQRAVVDAIHADLGWVTSDYISNWTGQDKATVRINLLALIRAGHVRTRPGDHITAIYSCCGS